MEMTTAIILGYIGVALMVGLSGAASCIGTSIAGQASVGAMKKNGGAFGSYMILSAIPGSQGLYGFVSYFIIKGFLTESITMLQGAAIFGAGLLTGFVCLFSAYYQARICANGIAAIGNGHDVMGKTLILAAFPELYAILTVAAVFLISGAICSAPSIFALSGARKPAGFRATVLSVHSLFCGARGCRPVLSVTATPVFSQDGRTPVSVLRPKLRPSDELRRTEAALRSVVVLRGVS